MLVLASAGHVVYDNARKVWKKYMNCNPNVKVYMVYGAITNLEDQDEHDLVYQDIRECYNPGMLLKTIRAMEYIDKHEKYDYFVRTNISTFWDFEKLLEHIKILPPTLCYSGDGPFAGRYLSGTDTIVTPEMIKEIIKAKDTLDYGCCEDDALGRFFNGVLGAPFLPNRICFLIHFHDPDDPNILIHIEQGIKSNCDHYRVKNHHRDIVDLAVYKCLLLRIYNITF